MNRAAELIGKELGMFRDDQPRKPITLEDLSDADLEKLLGRTTSSTADDTNEPPVQ